MSSPDQHAFTERKARLVADCGGKAAVERALGVDRRTLNWMIRRERGFNPDYYAVFDTLATRFGAERPPLDLFRMKAPADIDTSDRAA